MMNKNFVKHFGILFTIISFVNVVSAQIYNPSKGCYIGVEGECIPNTIVTAVPFLRIGPDARSGGMGDAGIAISPDANAMHFNPSKLAFAEENVGVSVNYTPWLSAIVNDVFLAYLSGYKKLDDLQAVGGSLRYFSLGDIPFTTADGQSLGTGSPNEFELALAYSRKLSDKLSVSLAGKYIYSNLAAGNEVNGNEIFAGHAGAADIGLTYMTKLNNDANLTLATSITNVGSKISYTKDKIKDYLPTNLGLGAAYEMEIDDYNKITFTLDVNKLMVPTPCSDDSCKVNGVYEWRTYGPVKGIFKSFGDAQSFKEEMREFTFSAGVEYWYADQFAIRAGYFHEDKFKGNRKYFTAGLGLKYNIFGLNFSYLAPTGNTINPLKNTLRFSFLLDFASE